MGVDFNMLYAYVLWQAEVVVSSLLKSIMVDIFLGVEVIGAV